MILLPEVRQNLIRRTSVQKVLGYYYTEIKRILLFIQQDKLVYSYDD